MRQNLTRLVFPRLFFLVVLLAALLGQAPAVLASPPGQQDTDQRYTVQLPDTLGTIASRFRVTVVSLLAANPTITNPNQIFPGEQLIIPAHHLQPGQGIWDGYTGRIPVTAASPASPAVHTQPAPVGTQVTGVVNPIGIPGTWNLIFADDFNGNGLDPAKWIKSFPWGPTSSSTPQLIYRTSAVSEGGGSVRLVAQGDSYQGYPYTSGIITTSGLFSYQYGLVEIRARVPVGQGLWSAFWSLPANGASAPEIDAMEVLGSDPSTVLMHYHDAAGVDHGFESRGPDFSAGWHTYAVDWEPDAITWYVDGVEQSRFADPGAIAAQPMYLIANLQVGGWPGNPDSTTPFPSTYRIDYVRVWQHGSP